MMKPQFQRIHPDSSISLSTSNSVPMSSQHLRSALKRAEYYSHTFCLQLFDHQLRITPRELSCFIGRPLAISRPSTLLALCRRKSQLSG